MPKYIEDDPAGNTSGKMLVTISPYGPNIHIVYSAPKPPKPDSKKQRPIGVGPGTAGSVYVFLGGIFILVIVSYTPGPNSTYEGPYIKLRVQGVGVVMVLILILIQALCHSLGFWVLALHLDIFKSDVGST